MDEYMLLLIKLMTVAEWTEDGEVHIIHRHHGVAKNKHEIEF